MTSLFVKCSEGQHFSRKSILNNYDLPEEFYLQMRKKWVSFNDIVVDILIPLSQRMAIQIIVFFLFE